MNNQETNYEQDTHSEESRGVAMNIFAILGFIAILLAGLWATVQLVKQVSNMSFDFVRPNITMNIFGDSDELTVVPSSKVANSAEPTLIKWTLGEDAQTVEGATLSFSYGCKRGLYAKIKDFNTNSYRAIPCNAPYKMPATDTELSIIPMLTDANTDELKYSITYTPAESSEIKEQVAQGQLQVTNIKVAVSTPKPSTTDSAVETPTVAKAVVSKTAPKVTNTNVAKTNKVVRTVVPVRKSDPNGLPDLTVKVLGVSAPDSTGTISVRFEVANIGTKMVGVWALSAALPTEPAFVYTSKPQQALYAGERAEILLTFNKLKVGSNPLLITIDPLGLVVESLETNNSVIQNIVR